jgi:hypothetical protein
MVISRWIKTCLGLAIPFALSFSAIARAEDIAVDHLRIELDTKKSRKPPKAKKEKSKYFKDWKKTCDQLGKAMTAEKGPWGFGTFGSYGCYRAKKKVGGTEKASKWTLVVVDGAKEVTFTILHNKTEVGQISMPPSQYTVQFFQDDEFSDLVSYAIMDSMPMGMLVTKAAVKGTTITGRYWRAGKSKDFKYKVPPPPENLVLYRLTFDESSKTWRSNVVGTAKKAKVTEPKPTKKKKTTTLVGGDVTYETQPAVAEALASGPLWAQNADGPGARKEELEAIIKEAQINLDAAAQNGQLLEFLKGKVGNVLTSLLDTAASGYVGIRYGVSVLPAEGELGQLIKSTSRIGLLVEIRGGPVKGLRYYYDKMPEKKLDLEKADGTTDTASIASARHTLGFSIDFNPGFIIDRITVDPKLGMWEFNARLPSKVNDDGKVEQMSDFNLGRTFSTALEIGLENLSDWYTLRGWYGIDTGFSLIKSGGRVTSNRLGIDAYFTAGPTFPIGGVPFKTALLAFYMYEHVNLTSGEDPDLEPGESAVDSIAYDSGYAGGGIAITW